MRFHGRLNFQGEARGSAEIIIWEIQRPRDPEFFERTRRAFDRRSNGQMARINGLCMDAIDVIMHGYPHDIW
jgi:hypothetical protein